MATKDMTREEVVAAASKVASQEAIVSVEMPSFKSPSKRYAFYYSDASADPPNALRAVDMCPVGGETDVLATLILPDDTISAIEDAMARLTKVSRDRKGSP